MFKYRRSRNSEKVVIPTSPKSNRAWDTRHSFVLWCFAAVFVCYIDRVNISVAALAMQEPFGWSEAFKGMVFSAFFFGYLLFQIPSGYLAHRFGGATALGYAVAFWSACTLLTPIAAMSSAGALIAVRVAMGMGEACMFPAMFSILSECVPATERSRSVAFLMSGIALGTLLGLAASGWIIGHYSWPIVFYVFGVVGLLWTVMWITTGARRRPRKTAAAAGGSVSDVPWRAWLASPAIWALIANHFCSNWTLYMLLAWLPSYFHAQGHSIANSGFRSVAPWITNLVVSNAGAWCADRMIARGFSVVRVRKAMQIIALIGSATALMIARNSQDSTDALLLMCGALGALGLILSGLYPNMLELAPKHAGVLMGFSNTIATLPGVVGVYVTGWLVEITGGYSAAFLLAATLNIVAASAYLLFAKSKPVLV